MTEEFPAFREFWLQKPEADDTHVRFYALLDGPSYAGVYAFKVHPGNETIVDGHRRDFTRREVKRLGISPMSSKFWFGENSRRRFDDFRLEVHDSDGLAIRMGSGERLWRPICNDSGQPEFSFSIWKSVMVAGCSSATAGFPRMKTPRQTIISVPHCGSNPLPTGDLGG